MRPEEAIAGMVHGNPGPGTAIIQGKLVLPPESDRHVSRPRVERRIGELIATRRLVVVEATPGSGKTTAVARAVAAVDRPHAWLTMDWTDAAPGRLVAYLEAAVARAVPAVEGVAKRALDMRIPQAEAAGMLAEAIGDERAVLVIDELERVTNAHEAETVLETFLRYAPPNGLTTVLISRQAVPERLLGPASHRHEVAHVGERELAFTPAEAAEALDRIGQRDVDPSAAVEATGGWVTGILFEAWRMDAHVDGSGGEADPLHGYLSAHILDQLSPEDAEFLCKSAILSEVTAERATALGLRDAAARLASLEAAHLPVTWRSNPRTMGVHSRFREYLIDRLEQRDAEERRALRIAHGRLLMAEGQDEEATEELLRAGLPDEALPSAERAIVTVAGRLDFDVAQRWLAELRGVLPAGNPSFTTARLLMALASDHWDETIRIADELACEQSLQVVARSSPTTAGLLAWCYLRDGRVDDATTIIDAAEPSPEVDAARYGAAFMTDELPDGMPPVPALSGSPLDALVVAMQFLFGRLDDLPRPPSSPWVQELVDVWWLGTVRARGETRRALELLEGASPRARSSAWMRTIAVPEILMDAGRIEEARAAVADAARAMAATKSARNRSYADVVAAKFALRFDGDPRAAMTALDRVDKDPRGRAYGGVRERVDTWYGFAHLLLGQDEAALSRLRTAIASMQAGDRILELPTAAVYLAEAEWRAGDEDAADAAADLALDAAHKQGSNHILLQALADFPAVVARRIDAEPGAASPWHELGRALIAQGVALAARPKALVELREYGRAALVVNREEVRPRIAKSYELLAYLIATPGAAADRDVVMDALFDGRTDDSTRAYLRQAIRWLRQTLPDGGVVFEDGRVWLADGLDATSESTWLQGQLAEAARLQGIERLKATLEALSVADRGEYLPGARSKWADERREALRSLVEDARGNAAELEFAAGRYDEARALAEQVVRADPFRESAWRLLMRIAHALGDEAGILRAYRRGEAALAPLDASPSPTTRQLLDALRR